MQETYTPMKTHQNQTTGRLIAFHRKAKDVKQEDFALTLGISQSKVSDWENDHKSPTVDDILNIAKTLDIHPYLLIPIVEQTHKQNPYNTLHPIINPSEVELQMPVQWMNEFKFFYLEILDAKNQTIEILKSIQK